MKKAWFTEQKMVSKMEVKSSERGSLKYQPPAAP